MTNLEITNRFSDAIADQEAGDIRSEFQSWQVLASILCEVAADGQIVAVALDAGANTEVQLQNNYSGEVLASMTATGIQATAAYYGSNGRVVLHDGGTDVRLLDLEEGVVLGSWTTSGPAVIATSSAALELAVYAETVTTDSIQRYSLVDGSSLADLSAVDFLPVPRITGESLQEMEYSPDGSTLACRVTRASAIDQVAFVDVSGVTATVIRTLNEGNATGGPTWRGNGSVFVLTNAPPSTDKHVAEISPTGLPPGLVGTSPVPVATGALALARDIQYLSVQGVVAVSVESLVSPQYEKIVIRDAANLGDTIRTICISSAINTHGIEDLVALSGRDLAMRDLVATDEVEIFDVETGANHNTLANGGTAVRAVAADEAHP